MGLEQPSGTREVTRVGGVRLLPPAATPFHAEALVHGYYPVHAALVGARAQQPNHTTPHQGPRAAPLSSNTLMNSRPWRLPVRKSLGSWAGVIFTAPGTGAGGCVRVCAVTQRVHGVQGAWGPACAPASLPAGSRLRRRAGGRRAHVPPGQQVKGPQRSFKGALPNQQLAWQGPWRSPVPNDMSTSSASQMMGMRRPLTGCTTCLPCR